MRCLLHLIAISFVFIFPCPHLPCQVNAAEAPERALPANIQAMLDRPVACCRYQCRGVNMNRAVLWEHILSQSGLGIGETSSIVILTLASENEPANLHRPIWATFSEKYDNYNSIENCTWDVVYHQETKRFYVAKLLAKPVAKIHKLELFEIDPESVLDLRKFQYDKEKRIDKQSISMAKPIGTYEFKAPKPTMERVTNLRDSLSNPKIIVHKDRLAIFASRPDESNSVEFSFDLNVKKWSVSK